VAYNSFFIPKFVAIFRVFLLKNRILKRILLPLIMIFSLSLNAQQHHEIGMTMGISNYKGDLQPRTFAPEGYHPMAGIMYKFFMNPSVGMRFGASYTSLSAGDSASNIPNNQLRNLSFATHLFEMHGGLEVNMLPIEILRYKFTPYVFGGISAFYFNPFAEDPNGNKVLLRPLSTEGQGLPMYSDRKQYSNVNLAFPIGGGIKAFLGQKLMLTGELGFRYTNTDYLDDVSKSYVNLDTLTSYKGKLAKAMAYRGSDRNNPQYGFQRGDTKTNDWYWFGNITVTVYFKAFGNTREYTKTRCPGVGRGTW